MSLSHECRREALKLNHPGMDCRCSINFNISTSVETVHRLLYMRAKTKCHTAAKLQDVLWENCTVKINCYKRDDRQVEILHHVRFMDGTM